MKLKNKTKFLLVLGIVFVAFLLFSTNNVNAVENDVTTSIEDEISNYKCSIEIKGGSYILYNNYFDTKDVTVNVRYISFMGDLLNITKENINQELFNNFLENVNDKTLLLVEVPSNTISVKESSSELEIIDLNNKKYVAIVDNMGLHNAGGSDTEESVEINSNSYHKKLEITRNETTETKEFHLQLNLCSENFFCCTVNVVNEKGVLYGSSLNMNGEAEGSASSPIPANIDFSKAYVEYYANQYMGESIKIDCLGTVPYVGKYGDNYKYRANLANVKTEFVEYQWGDYTRVALSDFSYKGSRSCNNLVLNENYTIDNETYIEKEETNTSTKLKFDLQGKFNGTLKAEEISKNDLIYNKVDEELKKYDEDNVFMSISNIYVENGGYEGPLKLTFNVGEQYNGKYYRVTHMKNERYEFENFEGIVENGKIEITVDSLSPFGILIANKKEEVQTPSTNNNKPSQEATRPNTDNNKPAQGITKPSTDNNNKPVEETTKPTQVVNKGEKDETPKTGTIDIISYVLVATTIAGIGIITLKKKLK